MMDQALVIAVDLVKPAILRSAQSAIKIRIEPTFQVCIDGEKGRVRWPTLPDLDTPPSHELSLAFALRLEPVL